MLIMTHVQPQPVLRKFVDSPNNHCFACGPGNPVGLHLRFEQLDGVVRTHFVPGEWHEGWQGIVHGGIVTTLLDEAMAYVLYFRDIQAVTARMEARFRGRVERGDDLTVEARLSRDTSKIADVEGKIWRDGTLVAEASARFMKLGRLSTEAL